MTPERRRPQSDSTADSFIWQKGAQLITFLRHLGCRSARSVWNCNKLKCAGEKKKFSSIWETDLIHRVWNLKVKVKKKKKEKKNLFIHICLHNHQSEHLLVLRFNFCTMKNKTAVTWEDETETPGQHVHGEIILWIFTLFCLWINLKSALNNATCRCGLKSVCSGSRRTSNVTNQAWTSSAASV